ncbi:hypothetical protein [Streptomyces buecherae]|uniref:hypothetical protein n=1 Tax=Streptomyces buecherae TaxID=2763006 RepID=UPI003648AA46
MTIWTDRRTTFVFTPPSDDATAWSLELDALAAHLKREFPGAWTKPEQQLGPGLANGLSFEVQLPDGAWLRGLATQVRADSGAVSVMDATAREAAVLAVSLRDNFVPASNLIEFYSDLGVEIGHGPDPLPAQGSVEEIATVLQGHLDTVDD